MVKLIVRALLVLVLFGWAAGTWFAGQAVDERLRSMIRDDPSNTVEEPFDPFAEPVVPSLLVDRIWLSMVEYRRTFFASMARMHLNLRLTPDAEPLRIPLVVKFHHGPLIFAGGIAVGAARVQITLDSSERRNLPARWGREARSDEGAMVTRGVLSFDGGFSGQTWLQGLSFDRSPIRTELDHLHVTVATDALFSELLIEGDMRGFSVENLQDSFKVAAADISYRAHNMVAKERYEGLGTANWSRAELNYGSDTRHISSMGFDSEYRLVDGALDAELSLSAESIETDAEREEDRELVLSYGEGVAAIGAVPIERVIDLWDSYRIGEPHSASLMGAEDEFHAQWRKAKYLMRQVSSNVSAYASFKLGIDEQELLMRANAEFIGEGDVESLSQVDTLGQLLDYLLADLTYQVDGRLIEIPEVQAVLDVASDMRMVETDEVGVSGNVHIRAGKVRVNGVEITPEQFLEDNYSQPIWPTVSAVETTDVSSEQAPPP